MHVADILEISDDNFEQEVLKSSTPVLVDFWAEWCGPCKALAPTIEQLSQTYAGKVKFCKVNVDYHPNQAARYGVRSIPTLILFQQGQNLGQLIGNVAKPTIESLLSKA
ncbi:MAG: thioredoxin [Deltaproteobacteria bacterium RIFCSPLOWO2_01_44_7]|nr:MAG: thioredoxin [Deltaproteobacteria bacterium RIFCSPHIGHO2_01_FULL_43_49]OGQ14238.1 MAG: thioredoxin [Deltaproteobacteria bacterium RIFCSPHIGHO2_02_FULL_44_53]OGQ27454.1 MAG: thioredoxin [Deltaproteobacteria bacterium RIFCSPHIGHO2_12_FULL_44_21]OGQ30702.1 MAG: thioredoxin [Deltaproteobacteria bacterium RIFCSPLOWO2_01_FULL_45_74]OGQ41430.1 MAG: thioredoxin [Deltaproteobacteria bacterium RIFCSPLOWO2_01_44_7]OGQ42379.1 MAG: thioredoxin [Deltaproteobacteria bacterium RIFCSPLOWO2_02_FULL_44_34